MAENRIRVLVVDDETEIRTLVTILLNRIGMEVLPAESAAEAAHILKTSALPDLMILDLMMPGVSGVDFLRQLRAKDIFEPMPVLVLSALVEPQQIREALDAGADRYLTKPYITNNLTTLVQDILRTGRRVRS